MHLRKHLLYILAGILVLALVYVFALADFFRPQHIASYENFTDISEQYEASEEIETAKENFGKSKALATVVTGNPNSGQKVVYLTFNGMESRGNMEQIVKILQDKGFQASFFVEGANAAHEQDVMQKLQDSEQLIGNYSFVGITRGELLDTDRLIEQFCKTQKVLELTAGGKASYFALPDTRYLPALLRAAKASGLDYAVQSNLVIKESDLVKPGAVQNILQQIQPGMIVSLRFDHPVPIIFYEKKEADVPAVDKKPTVQDKPVAKMQTVPVVEAVTELCDALASQGYRVAPVSELQQVVPGSKGGANGKT